MAPPLFFGALNTPSENGPRPEEEIVPKYVFHANVVISGGEGREMQFS